MVKSLLSPMTSLFVLCLVTCFVYTVNGIKCHQCNSVVDPDCLTAGPNNTKYFKECVGDYGINTPFCRKTYLNIKDNPDQQFGERVIRGCGFLKYHIDCYKTDDDFHLEIVCQCEKEGCNTGSRITQTTVGVLFLSLLSITASGLFK